MVLKNIASALIDAYNHHDPDAVAPCYHPDATHLEVTSGRVKHGRDAIVGGLGYFFKAFPDACWLVESTAVTDHEAAIRYRLVATLQADLGPYVAQGQSLVLPGVLWLTTDGSAITSSADYWDAASFHRQMQAN